MTPCLSHNFPPMYLKRNTTTRLLNLRTLLCMQLLTYATVFEYIVWPIRRTVRRVNCKKTQLYTTFDLQGHARVQIFTYQDVSVCNVSSPNFHMFYVKRRVSTQISRLRHVHAQVHTLKDMSRHTFCLMEMCPSTVWHLVSHYFVWCEGTIIAMFTLTTLLGCVYVQLLTYEDVSVCISLTWSPRMHTDVQLKTRSHTCVHVFLTKTHLYPSFLIWDSCLYHVLSHNFDRKECFYTTFDIQGGVFENSSSWPTCLHATSSTMRGGTNQNTVFCHAI